MNSQNILQRHTEERAIVKKVSRKPSKWTGLFNWKNAEDNLRMLGRFSSGGCVLVRQGHSIKCMPMSFLVPASRTLSVLTDLDSDLLFRLSHYLPVEFETLEQALFYTHLDLIAAYLTMPDLEFINHLTMGEGGTRGSGRYKPSIVEVNQNSIYLEQSGNDLVAPPRVADALKAAFLKLGLRSMEVPRDYDQAKTLETLEEFHENMVLIDFPDAERGFNLKFKKLGTHKANGYYSHELNVVIVDPRSTHVFYHELGHLIFDRNVSINADLPRTDSEDFAQRFFTFVTGRRWA